MDEENDEEEHKKLKEKITSRRNKGDSSNSGKKNSTSLEKVSSALVYRASREELENLILTHISTADILANLGDESKNKSIAATLSGKVQVEKVALREGQSTGGFDRLNDESVILIFQFLKSAERLKTLSVCKSW